MDDLQNQMSAILGNPEMMQKIMAMAQTLNPGSSPKQEAPKEPPKQDQGGFSLPDIDLSMIQKLSGFASQSRIDANQANLLKALGPYLQKDRLSKLERAMRAAKMAGMASVFLQRNPSGTGR